MRWGLNGYLLFCEDFMPFLKLDGEQLFFKLQDEGAARDILWVHGSGADHSHWPVELAELPDYNVYFLDLPGHGQSTGRGWDSVAGYADAIAGFIEKRRLSQVILGGHSLGGAIVQILALRHPAWLKALVLVGSGARLKVLPELLQQLETDFPAAVELMCQALFGPEAPPALVAAERQRLLATDWRLIQADFTACNRFDVMERLTEIAVPTLVVTGSADLLTPLKYGRFLNDAIPGAQLAVIANAGHMAAREKPAEFIQTVQVFLASVT